MRGRDWAFTCGAGEGLPRGGSHLSSMVTISA